MTIAIAPATRSYPDDEEVEVGACTGCLDLLEVVELTDCGTHTLCPSCLATSPCSACQWLRHDHAADLAEQAAYDAWRDAQAQEDLR
ncbi:MAG TPA: hypothetical protein VGE38_06980 [Nocardioides sp.]|uniref:hypothetical protein n=1 Tax=Nocardioides sp. TaxID=35761 RepID=UPI002ED9E9B5